MQSSNLGITFLALNQSKKEVTVNEALLRIDAIQNTCIIDINIDTPVENPKNGDLYGVGKNPILDWKDNPEELAFWYINSWRYIKPKIGILMWIKNKSALCVYNGKDWIFLHSLTQKDIS